jgi:hypothetical protein
MLDIQVSKYGCRTGHGSDIPFKCQMCYPAQSEYDPKVMDRAKQCAISKINKGLVYYYYERKYEYDLYYDRKTLVEKRLIEKWKHD